MRKLAVTVLAAAACGAALAEAVLHEHGLAHALGIDTQQSQEYDFFSGPGPVFVALLGYSSLVITAVHQLNCHQPGCWRFGRHREAGGTWCRRHRDCARRGVTDSDRLDRIIELLETRPDLRASSEKVPE